MLALVFNRLKMSGCIIKLFSKLFPGNPACFTRLLDCLSYWQKIKGFRVEIDIFAFSH